EDHRLDDRERDVGGGPHPDQQVAPGDRERVAHRPAGPGEQVRLPQRYGDRGHDAALPASLSSARRPPPRLARSVPSPAPGPDRAMNGRESDGRGAMRPRVSPPAASSPRTASMSASEPRPPTPTLITPVSPSMCGSASPIFAAAPQASPIRDRSGTVNSR